MPIRPLVAVLSALVLSVAASGQTYTISTFAGGGLPANIPGTSASLDSPLAVAVDKHGNLFFVDQSAVFRLDAATGIVTPVAGNGTFGFSGDNGTATSAQLGYPQGLAVDSAGNLYIADTTNCRVRKVTNGVITTVAGNGTYGYSGDNGPATSAEFREPYGVAVDSAGNLYIVDGGVVRKVSGGVIATVAGSSTQPFGFSGDNGPATSAQLNQPGGVAVDSAGNLYIADMKNNRIRKVTNGVITTVAGSGPMGSSGDNGSATSAQLTWPQGVAVDSAGNLYIADTDNYRVREVSNGVIVTLAGNGTQNYGGDNGPAASAQLNWPEGVAVDSTGNLYIADTYSHCVRKVSGGVITTIAGNGEQGFSGDNGPATSARLSFPGGVAVDSAGSVYIADAGNNRIRKVAGGTITTVAGDGLMSFGGDNGPATSAQLNDPNGVALDSTGNLYIADWGNNRIRKVSNGLIATVAGGGFSNSGGPATSAQLSNPQSVAVDSAGNLYIAETGDIREVSNGTITAKVEAGVYGAPRGVAVDSAGNVYVADTVQERIFRVTNGAIAAVAGNGTQGYSGDGGPATSAQLNQPSGVAVDSAGNVYVADTSSNRIRLLTPGTAPAISTIAPIYSSAAVVQPGSWVSIFGSNLASGTSIWNGDFPKTLGGTSVLIDGRLAYLWFVSPTQINLQVPDDATTGPVSVAVTTASGTATSTVTMAQFGPSFSLLGDGKHVAAEIATPNGTGAYGGGIYDLVGPANTFSFNTRPVHAGETLTLFGVGFGPTNPVVPPGQLYAGPAAPTSNHIAVTIGGVSATVGFTGIIGAGLYQLNVTVPTTGSGDQPLVATVGGVQTPAGPVVTVQ